MSGVVIALFVILLSGFLPILFKKSNLAFFFWQIILVAALVLLGHYQLSLIIKNNIGTSFLLFHQELFRLQFDTISLFFSFFIILFGLLGTFYVRGYYQKTKHPKYKFITISYSVFILGMLLVVLSDGILFFLLSWEVMSLSSTFLILIMGECKEGRNAAFVYFTNMQISFFFIAIFWIFVSDGNFIFSVSSIDPFTPINPYFLFLFLILGFGIKIGAMPFHAWMPIAYPAAPSFASALMSGVMSKVGVYGLLRGLMILKGSNLFYVDVSLLLLGLITMVVGILLALYRRNLKRVLAYSSVENMGIILAAIGLTFYFLNHNLYFCALLSLFAIFFHILNHAILKTVLFFLSGAIFQVTKTYNINSMGGLLKLMPHSGFIFFFSCVAMSGLPLANMFVGEFLLYYAAFLSIAALKGWSILASVIFIIFLSITGGLALLNFSKTYSMIFLGENRLDYVDRDTKNDSSYLMLLPSYFLLVVAILITLFPYKIAKFFSPLVKIFIERFDSHSNVFFDYDVLLILKKLGQVTLWIYVIIIIFIVLRVFINKTKKISSAPTWDCGFTWPNTRMQYSAHSFSYPITVMFKTLVRITRKATDKSIYFPKNKMTLYQGKDFSMDLLYRPLYRFLKKKLGKLRIMQMGNTNFYIVYVVITLLFLLIWKMD